MISPNNAWRKEYSRCVVFSTHNFSTTNGFTIDPVAKKGSPLYMKNICKFNYCFLA